MWSIINVILFLKKKNNITSKHFIQDDHYYEAYHHIVERNFSNKQSNENFLLLFSLSCQI